jgi:hypothetical protein
VRADECGAEAAQLGDVGQQGLGVGAGCGKLGQAQELARALEEGGHGVTERCWLTGQR